MLDVFGMKLELGQTVMYADGRDDSTAIVMDMYLIAEIDDGKIIGERKSGDEMGEFFYLTNTRMRALILPDPFDAVGLADGALLN